jgi:hypothetical protein
MNEAREDVLAFRHFPQPHWKKGLEHQPARAGQRRATKCAWQRSDHLEGRRMFSAESMVAIPELEDLPALLSAATSSTARRQHIRGRTRCICTS